MNNVRMLRLQRGMQQKELAIEIGVANATVSDWEHGRKNPSGERLRKLADFFNVSPQAVLGDEDIEHELQKENQEELKENSGLPGKEAIIKFVMERLTATDSAQKTQEMKIVSEMMGKMSKEQQEQVVAVIRAMFANHPDILE